MTILSIQSHVSYGHVGNSAGVFILQRLGLDVWPVHTVLFSNHPGYETFRGSRVAPDLITDVISGIEERGVLSGCRAVIGGYLGSVATGVCMIEAVQRVKLANPESIFFCDPVMGDREKGLYVSEDVVQFYREQGAPAADVLKPNAFELEVLSGHKIHDPGSASAAAMDLVKRWDLQAVLVSSVPVPASTIPGPLSAAAPTVSIASIVVTPEQVWSVETPLLPVDQKGAGDAFMALFVANLLATGKSYPEALSASASAIWSIMEETARAGVQELQLIKCQSQMSRPSSVYGARPLVEYE